MCNEHGKAPCLPRGRDLLCSTWGSLQRPWRGEHVWHVCLSSDALVSEDERLGSAPRRFPGSAQSFHVSPGRTQEEGGPLSPSGGPADSQGCHTVGPLCARTPQSCLDHLSLFFSGSPPSKSLSQSFPSPLLPSPSSEALEVPQTLSDPSIPPHRLPAFSLLLLQVAVGLHCLLQPHGRISGPLPSPSLHPCLPRGPACTC